MSKFDLDPHDNSLDHLSGRTYEEVFSLMHDKIKLLELKVSRMERCIVGHGKCFSCTEKLRCIVNKPS